MSGLLLATVGREAGARGLVDIAATLVRRGLGARQVRDRMSRALTPRERERWHAPWLLAQGWSASTVADFLGRDAHTIGGWLAAFERAGPAALVFEQTGAPPPSSTRRPRRG